MIWTEKYRPTKWEHAVGPSKLLSLKNKDTHPPLLIYGSPGTGKTSFVKVIINEWKMNALEIDGSKERGIDVIRNRIDLFCKCRSVWSHSGGKIVVIEEADGLTKEAQRALKETIEKYHRVPFIFTTNYPEKIDNAVKSRCVSLNFNKPDKKRIKERLSHICNQENRNIVERKLKGIIRKFYPDIRQMVLAIQFEEEAKSSWLTKALSRWKEPLVKATSKLASFLKKIGALAKTIKSALRQDILSAPRGVPEVLDHYKKEETGNRKKESSTSESLTDITSSGEENLLEKQISFIELQDGTLVEEVFNEEGFELVIFKEGNIKYTKRNTTSNNEVLVPMQAQPIEVGALKLPERAEEYGDDNRLLEGVQKFIHKYVELAPFEERLSSYYVLFSWVYDRFSEVPFLRALGDFGTGKSRFLKTIGGLCYKPAFFSPSSSLASIFRTIHTFGCSICIDEADFRYSNLWADIIKFLNSRFEKQLFTWKAETSRESSQRYGPYAFGLFGPTLLATRKRFEDEALESRCLTTRMRERTRKDIPLNLPPEFYEEQKDLRNKLLLWRLRNYQTTGIEPNQEIQGVESRLNQIAIPLLSVIKKPHAREELSQFVRKYQKDLREDRASLPQADLLAIVDKLFHEVQPMQFTSEQQKAECLSYTRIVSKFNEGREDTERMREPKLGYMLKELGFKKDSYGSKAYLPNTEENTLLLGSLKERYGILGDAKTPKNKENRPNAK